MQFDKPTRVLALFAACIHHGLSNISAQALPPNQRTVIATAAAFEVFLETGVVPERTPESPRQNGLAPQNRGARQGR